MTLARARIGAFALLALLSVLWLADVPATWFDEGSHLHVPQMLVERGVYADYSADELRFGGPVLGVGPTVMLPIAASFKLFGVGVAQGRAVIVVFLLLFLATTWRFARQLASERVADLTILFLIGAPAVNALMLGRQVLGEVPALWFVMLGLIAWHRAVASSRTFDYVMSGVAFGLAAVTKYQLLIMLVPGLSAAWFVARLRGGWVPHRAFFIPLGVCGIVFAAWQAMLLAYVGSDAFAANVIGVSTASRGAAVIVAAERMREGLRTLFGIGAFVGLAIPALVWVSVRELHRRDPRAATWMLLASLACAHLGWFVVGSIGWPRYAVPGLALASMAVASMLDQLISGSVTLGNRPSAAALRTVGWLWVALAGPLPLLLTVATILTPPPNAARAMAAFLDRTLPPSAIIETWEPELSVMSRHRFRFPPNTLLATAVANRFANGPALSTQYDFTKPSPDYVVVGEFATWVDVYPRDRLLSEFELLHEEGPFHLFQRRTTTPGGDRE